MSVESMSVVLHHSRAKGSAKLLLVGIANHDGDGGAWPTVNKLAVYLNVHPRNVQRAIERVEQLGELAVELQRGGTLVSHASDWERPNRYVLTIDCPEGCAGGTHHRARPGWQRLPSGDYVRTTSPVDNGVAKTPPGGESATRPGGESATHNRPINRSAHRGASTTGVTPPCVECSAPDLDTCVARQRNLAREDRHDYQPRPFRQRDAS